MTSSSNAELSVHRINLAKAESLVPARYRSSRRWDPLAANWPADLITEPGATTAGVGMSEDEYLELVVGALVDTLGRGEKALRVLAAICDWGGVTIEQLAAITDITRTKPDRNRHATWDELPAIVTDLWTVGLIERTQLPDGPIILSPGQSPTTEALPEALSDEDRSYLLGAHTTWAPTPTDLRRTVIATEAALRVQATFGTDQFVVPGRQATYGHLCGDPTVVGTSDAVIYSADQYSAVAMTVITSADPDHIHDTVQDALELLRRTGDTMVWLIEAAPSVEERAIWEALTGVVATVVDGPDKRLADRIAVSRWRWFWPTAGEATTEAVDGLAYTATGDPDQPWAAITMGWPRGDFDIDLLEQRLPARNGASTPRFARNGTWAL